MNAVEIANRILEKLPGLLECEDFIADDAIHIDELRPLCEAVMDAELAFAKMRRFYGDENPGIVSHDWLKKHAGEK